MDSSEIRRLEVKQSEVALQIRRESVELAQVQCHLDSASQNYVAQVKSFGEIQSRVEHERLSRENPALRFQKVGYLKQKLLAEAREVQTLRIQLQQLESAKSKVIDQILVKKNRTEKIVEIIQSKKANIKRVRETEQMEEIVETKIARRCAASKTPSKTTSNVNKEKFSTKAQAAGHARQNVSPIDIPATFHNQLFNSQQLFDQGQHQPSNQDGQELLERIYDQIDTIKSWKEGAQSGLSLNFSSQRGNMLGLEVSADDQQNLSVVLSSSSRTERSMLVQEKSRVLKKLTDAGLKVKDIRIVEESSSLCEGAQ